MSMELNEKTARLLSDLMDIPPDFSKVEETLRLGLSSDEITKAVIQFIENCYIEDLDAEFEDAVFSPPALDKSLHSGHLYSIVEYLLPRGIDPNAVYEEDSLLTFLPHIVNEYAAADTLGLLLANGLDPHIELYDGDFFWLLDFDVMFDAFNMLDRRRFDALVHCWFVCLGYGAGTENGKERVICFPDRDLNDEFNIKPFEIADLKEHRNYSFALSNVEGQGENWSMHIIDKRTFWEVARL